MCTFIAYVILIFVTVSLVQDLLEILTLDSMQVSICQQTAYCAPFGEFVEMIKARSLFSTFSRVYQLF